MAKNKNKKQQRNNRNKQQQTRNNSNKRSTTFRQNSNEDNDGDDIVVDLLMEKMNSVSLAGRYMNNLSPVQISDFPSGLPNLGNTCYFNSVMQVMGQTYILHHLLKERCQEDFIWQAKTFYWKEKTQSFGSESMHLKLPPPMALVEDFLQLQQQIFERRSTNPRALLGDIQREKRQFEGYSQQDAQELLITLLDAIKKSECYRQQKSLIQGLKIEDSKNPSNEEREKAQRYKITAKHTVVDAIFGGQLLSIIHCTVCDYRSFTFEPFVDLALSLKNSDKPINNLEKLFAANKQHSGKNSDKKNKTSKKKHNKTLNDSDSQISTDDDSCTTSLIENETSEILHSNNSCLNKKQQRQEKKAARRAERRRIKMEKQKTKKSKESEDDELEEEQDNQNDKEKSQKQAETLKMNGNISISKNLSDCSQNNNKNNTNRIQQSDDDDDDDGSSDIDDDQQNMKATTTETSISNSSSVSSSLSTETNSQIGSTANCIKDDFRYKFYLFAHQRMSRTDDDYQNLDLGALLRNFIKEECLDGNNKYLCENCSKLNNNQKTYSKAIRCQLIALPPPVLILQLKRFEASGFGAFNKRMASMHKLNTKVTFPEKLYLSPYTSRIYEYFSKFYEPECDPIEISDQNEERLQYTLYGVVIHSGSLGFGHYMANVCVRPADFQCANIKRFLHLKPFVSNIEHILQVVHEDLIINNQQNQSQNHSLNNNNETNHDNSIVNGMMTEDSETDSEESSTSNSKMTKKTSRRWYSISDSHVSPTTQDSVIRDVTSPYLLFYERTK